MRWIRSILVLALLSIAIAWLPAAPQRSIQSGKAAEAARGNNLGCAYMNQQLFEKALQAFRDASGVDPHRVIARVNQGIALLNLQKVEEAKKVLLEATREDANDPYAWYNLGLLAKNSGDPETAVGAFRRVAQIDPNDADTWYLLGTAYAQAKQFPQAIESFQQSIKLNPLHASAEFGLARAYRQAGELAQGRRHLERFQYITQHKLGTTMSLAYGEQGKYSRTEEAPSSSEQVPAPIPVRFVDVTQSAGLTTKPAFAPATNLESFLGSGACFLDYDGDGKLDLFVADGGKQSGLGLYHNLGGGKFEDVSRKAGFDTSLHGIACSAGDYDNDGAPDLAVSLGDGVLLFHNEKNGTFKDVSLSAGLSKPTMESSVFTLGVTFIDYDHDGDLDLYLSRFLNAPLPEPGQKIDLPKQRTFLGNQMWRNNGNGTFTNVTEDLALEGTEPGISAVGTDYNNDRAVDILATSWEATPRLYENPREGRFLARRPWPASMAGADPQNLGSPAVGIAVLDFDHDGWMDVAFTHWGAPGLTLWHNHQGKEFQPVALPLTHWVRGWGVAALDYDNDGWIDLAALGENQEGKGEIRLFRNLGPDGFKDVTHEVGLDQIQLKDPRSLVTGDVDGDGATDLLITQNHGPLVLLRNQGGNQNHWLRLTLQGLNDNKTGIGTKVEVFAGGNWQKWEIYGSSGYLGQNASAIIAGLGAAKQADVVRMLWPTGVLQDEIQMAASAEKNLMEIDRRGSSCPTLFVWDGKQYELLADVIGAGVVGHWVAPGERNIPRPTEYIKVERRQIAFHDGRLSFRLLEPMEEVVYLDQVKLLAIDHPAEVDVYPNEYFAANPPFPSFQVVESRRAQPPAGAWDNHGHNVLPDLVAHRYFGDFERLPFKGFTKLHSLELDLGEPYGGGPLRLLMHGEIEYFTATGMYAASQSGIQATSPYVEAQDGVGNWRRVVDDIGFPAGLPRTMTADLTGRLPIGTRRIRIWTNLQIYWDNILIDRTPQKGTVRISPLPLVRADLRFHGYPRQIEDQPPGNVKYVYEQVSPTAPYARQAGNYTRYGDVRLLLSDLDDRFVVFGSGEEVALEFDPTRLPSLPPGWSRDYFFEANGYEKDMDFYAAEGDTVEPLPFRAMKTYPYPGQHWLDDAHLSYVLDYNTRHLSGHEPRGYSYQYSK